MQSLACNAWSIYCRTYSRCDYWFFTHIYGNTPYPSMDVMFYYAKKATAEVLNLQPGDNIVLTGGTINGRSGNTDTIKIEAI